MRFRPVLLIAALACSVLLATRGGAADAVAAESWTVSGKRYEHVRVLEVTAATVMIAHDGGMAQVDLAALPPDLQQRFHYRPEAAAAWRQEAASALAATEALRIAEDRARQRRASDEAARRVLEDRRADEPASSTMELLPEVDLRTVFASHSLYLKNQGARPSCSIFAVVGVLEYEYARRFGATEQLSEEFLIWAFRRDHPGKPINDGYHFGEVLETLRRHGIARRDCLPDSFASHLRDEAPPQSAIDEAANRRRFQIVGMRPGEALTLARIVQALNQKTPVIIGVGWPHHSTLQRNNLLKDQVPLSGAGHAVTLVGYRSEGTPESLVFIFRNSYGPQWGLGGYGLMAASYLEKHLLAAFCLVVPPLEQES